MNAGAEPPINWLSALKGEFGEPTSEREHLALDEKVTALRTLFSKRLSILTGGAGTGKTSALKVFLQELLRAEGRNPMLLLAPTGESARSSVDKNEAEGDDHPSVSVEAGLVHAGHFCAQTGERSESLPGEHSRD